MRRTPFCIAAVLLSVGVILGGDKKPAERPPLQISGVLESGTLAKPIDLGGGQFAHALTLTAVPGKAAAYLEIVLSPRQNDEGGWLAGANHRPPVRGEVQLTFLKDAAQGRTLYSVKGLPIGERLVVVAGTGDPGKCSPQAAGTTYQLQVRGSDGKIAASVSLHPQQERQAIPCHPGCFPAGTIVETPTGPRRIESIRAGDDVLNVRPDGQSNLVKVASVFTGHSTLVEVETDRGVLLTTGKQPLCLIGGSQKSSLTLKPGDVLACWKNGRATVTAVRDPRTPARIYNLVLEVPGAFVANGYIVRSKPPALP